MQGTPRGNRRSGQKDRQGADRDLGKVSEEVKLKDIKPLRPAVLTFRPDKKGTGKAHLVPMIDGVDIPHVKSMALQQPTAEEALLVITLRLPNGIVIE